MNTKEVNDFFDQLLTIIRQTERSPEARLIDLKNRIYNQQSAMIRDNVPIAEKRVVRESDGDILFA